MARRPTVFLAADHGGHALAKKIYRLLTVEADVVMLTPSFSAGDDYPVIAWKLTQQVEKHLGSFGVGVCHSGVGMALVGNKRPGIRAAQAHSAAVARRARQDEDARILSLGADHLTSTSAIEICRAFIRTPFKPAARYQRRLREIARYEHNVRR